MPGRSLHFFNSSSAKNHKFSFAATDEMTSIFLHYPELFIIKTLGNISDCTPSDPGGLRQSAIRILKGETVARNQVIKEFPVDTSFYFSDLSGSVNRDHRKLRNG